MYSKQLYFTLVVVSISAAVQANAGQANPLHPSHFWDSAPKVQAVTSDAKPYADRLNPLHPTYGRVGAEANWQHAVGSFGIGYRDSNNPLHPSFVR